jgi:hypothetical protein
VVGPGEIADGSSGLGNGSAERAAWFPESGMSYGWLPSRWKVMVLLFAQFPDS